ncbi:hypothetical protein GTQ99_23635, partial [Kineococcus sp. T13]|uniref:MauE/DoxX family redox-associated membrane protein n=1 Tax=Kineococcus vitellinus TaxID=2696565 RepID=UPI001411BBA6
MAPLLVPYLAAGALLAVAGWGKLRRPAATVQALRTQGLPVPAALVRLLGAAELALALAAVAGPPQAAWAVAAAYTAFSGFVLLALLRGRPLSSCGCFGEPDLPPTAAHLGVTAAAALVAVLTALAPAGPHWSAAAGAGGALLVAVFAAVLAGLARRARRRT